MKCDKYKNKDRSKFIREEERHGKRDVRPKHRIRKIKPENFILRDSNKVDIEALEDIDIDKFEKMG